MPVKQPEERSFGSFEEALKAIDRGTEEIWLAGNAFLEKIAEILALADAATVSQSLAQLAHCGQGGESYTCELAYIRRTSGGQLPIIRAHPTIFLGCPNNQGMGWGSVGSGRIYVSVIARYSSPNRIAGDPSTWYRIEGIYTDHPNTLGVSVNSAHAGWISEVGISCDNRRIPEGLNPIVCPSNDWYACWIAHQAGTLAFNPIPDDLDIDWESYGHLEIYFDVDTGYYWFEGDPYAVAFAYSLYFSRNWGVSPLTSNNGLPFNYGYIDSDGYVYCVYSPCDRWGTPIVSGVDRTSLPLSDIEVRLDELECTDSDRLQRLSIRRCSQRTGFDHPLNILPLSVDDPCVTEILSTHNALLYTEAGARLGQHTKTFLEPSLQGLNDAYVEDFSDTGLFPAGSDYASVVSNWADIIPGSVVFSGDSSGLQYLHASIVVGWGNRVNDWWNGGFTLYATYSQALDELCPSPPGPCVDTIVPYVVDRGTGNEQSDYRGPRPFDAFVSSSGREYYQPNEALRVYIP